MGAARRLALGAGAAAAGGVVWWRVNPSAFPYSQRFLLEFTHPFLTRQGLRDALSPIPGERILEVGPGTGFYALAAAEWVQPGGQVEVLDLQQEMLDHTMESAREQGISNVVASRGDARELPYADESIDGAFLVTVLGEIPDQEKGLRELRRVLKPGGRIVVGEIVLDPHFVTRPALSKRAQAAGLRLERSRGNALSHFTRLARD